MTLAAIQVCLANRLAPEADRAERFAGIIGDRPSKYAKSPSLWNAVFRDLSIDAVYLPFDVDAPNLGPLVGALRQAPRLLGCNVTVPYKVKIIEHLDGLDDKARQIGAVNTVVRTAAGRLIGYNTDGAGFLGSLTEPLLPQEAPLLPDPKGVDVLLVGAGGAARAVAFYLAEAIGRGRLTIANRTPAPAASLAAEVNQAYGNAVSISEDDVAHATSSVGLIVNSSTKGQSGIRRLSDGRATILEPYSALAPAAPAILPYAEGPDFSRKWFEASLADIERNNHASGAAALRMPATAAASDLVYAPLETVFLRQCRLTGHRTANGKGMNIAQAVDALFDKVCRDFLVERGLGGPDTRRRIIEVMSAAW